MKERISLISAGLGSLSGNTSGITPSHLAARLNGPARGQKPPTQIGILGFWRGVGKKTVFFNR